MSTTSCSFTPSWVAICLDLVGLQIALLERRDPALGLAQVEEQLLLVGGRAHLHQRPRAQDVFLDRRLDPPHRIGGEAEALVGLEALDGLHQADIAFGNDFADRQAIAAIAHGDLGHETQMGGDELVRGVAVAMLAPALGEHVFFAAARASGNLTDFVEIAGKAPFGGKHGKRCEPCHLLLWLPLSKASLQAASIDGRPPKPSITAADLVRIEAVRLKIGRNAPSLADGAVTCDALLRRIDADPLSARSARRSARHVGGQRALETQDFAVRGCSKPRIAACSACRPKRRQGRLLRARASRLALVLKPAP